MSNATQKTQADFDNVAALLLWYLQLENVEYVFGVPGAAIATILNQIAHDTPGIEYIVSKHESGGAYMAEGYYRATGHPGVVAVTSGPGATNALTGTLSAQFGGSAVVTITGEPIEQWIGRGVYQEGVESGLDTSAVYDAAVRYSARITDPGSARTIIQEALRTAMSIPRNAVHLAIPEDIAKTPLKKPKKTDDMAKQGVEETDGLSDKYQGPRDLPIAETTSNYRAEPTGSPNQADIEKVHAALFWAERPVILLGEGCREPLRDQETYEALLGLVDKYQIPVMTTPDGKGLFPENHPLSLRVYGFASCRWPYQWLGADGGPKHDVLLVIGSQLGKLSTETYNRRLVPEKDFFQVDIDPRVIGRAFLVTHGIVADAGAFIKSLSTALSNPDPNRVRNRALQIKAIKNGSSPFATMQDYGNHPQYYSDRDSPSDKDGIEPAALIKVLQEVLDESGKESMVFIDHANSVGWGTHYFEVTSLQAKPGERPNRPKMEYHQSLGMASMGFGVCPVIGAKLAKKDRICVGLTGDGAFLMHGAEVTTAAKYKIGAVWVVLEDRELNMVTQGMHHYTKFERTFSYPIGSDEVDPQQGVTETDLHGVAYSYGANAVRVEKFNDLKAALEDAVKRGGADSPRPQVVVVRINKDRVPPYYIAKYKKSDAEVSFAF